MEEKEWKKKQARRKATHARGKQRKKEWKKRKLVSRQEQKER